MISSTLPPRPVRDAGPPLPRRRWLWLAAGATAIGAAGAFAAYRRWQQPARPSADELLAMGDFCIVAPPLPYDAASHLPPDVPRPVPADARCPVCGMFPARNPRWAAQVLYTDHAVHYFDSPVNLMLFLDNVGRYSPGRNAASIQSRWVTDAVSSQWIALEKAWFVHGSEVMGPMRSPDLPAFASQQDAQRFAAKRGGQVLTLAQLTPDIVQSLSTQRVHKDGHDHSSHLASQGKPAQP